MALTYQPERAQAWAPPGLSAVIFDGDDTLWLTEALYDEARQAAKTVVEGAGLHGDRWEELERLIDVANVARLGHTPRRFPTSCLEALNDVAAEAGVDPTSTVRAAVWMAAEKVFHVDPPVRPEARAVLSGLRDLRLRLALLTKGDATVQGRRIERSGLSEFFDVIRIVPAKTDQDFRSLANELGCPIDAVVSVGNSVRSDIHPSVAAGIAAVWIPAHAWEYERTHDHLELPPGVIEIEALSELLAVIR